MLPSTAVPKRFQPNYMLISLFGGNFSVPPADGETDGVALVVLFLSPWAVDVADVAVEVDTAEENKLLLKNIYILDTKSNF